METFTILDDGSESTILLHSAAQQLGIKANLNTYPYEQLDKSLRYKMGL